jgi:hypothetical protein
MAKHFSTAKLFESVKDKTLRMINKRAVPPYMIDFYKR